MNVPLSVVILAKNEAGRLAECLRSVEWAALGWILKRRKNCLISSPAPNPDGATW